MNDIETRIKERNYQTPGRARAAIKMAKVKGKVRAMLDQLVDEWESEGAVDAVVAGEPTGDFEPPKRPKANGKRHPQMSGSISDLPAAAETAVETGTVEHAPVGALARSTNWLAQPIVVSLNARIRARLTPYGVTLLYAARGRVVVPDDLMSKQGVWDTSLWEFMAVVGDRLAAGEEAVTEGSNVELLSRGP